MKLDYTANNFAALDRFGRVVDQIWMDYGAEPLDHYSYTYDRAGNRTSRDNELHAAFDEDYTYDELDRLISSVRADNFDQTWDLDGLGNFSEFDDDGDSQTRTVNEANEIEGITGGWITPTYDAAGNMKFGPKPGEETTGIHYVYDAWNRLVAVYEDDDDGVYEPGAGDDLVAQYEYDGVNRRIEKVVTGSSHSHYYYNLSWQMLEEDFVDAQGATVARNQYVWSPRYVDSPVVRFHDANADGDLEDAGDATRYYTSDANHNVTAAIDAASGAVSARYVYTPYGTATAYDANWSNPAAPAEDGPLYCGYFFDAESSLYQVRNRYYDSSLSAFISRDPVGYDAGTNLYEYCDDNPLTHIDPLGYWPASWSDFPGSALTFTGWSSSKQIRFIGKFYREWATYLHTSAKKHCIPENLLFAVIIAEVIDFDWYDYNEFGDSLGPGQITSAMMTQYDLHGSKKNVQQNIDMTADRLDKQIEELCLALNGGGSSKVPAFSKTPNLQNVPAICPNYKPWGNHNCQWDPSSKACDRSARCKDPSVTYSLIQCTGKTPYNWAAATLVGVLTEMNDLIFQPGGKGPSYIRAGDLLTRSHANAISSLITSGIVQP